MPEIKARQLKNLQKMNNEQKDQDLHVNRHSSNEMLSAALPVRVQRKRSKGWKMPLNTVYVGRGTRFGNPFRLDADGFIENYTRWGQWENWSYSNNFSIKDVVELYEQWVDGQLRNNRLPLPPRWSDISNLKGKNLSCFCPLSEPCHADVLLRLANG